MAGEAEAMTTFDQIDELAQILFHASEPETDWGAIDPSERLHWRREAQRRLQRASYKDITEPT